MLSADGNIEKTNIKKKYMCLYSPKVVSVGTLPFACTTCIQDFTHILIRTLQLSCEGRSPLRRVHFLLTPKLLSRHESGGRRHHIVIVNFPGSSLPFPLPYGGQQQQIRRRRMRHQMPRDEGGRQGSSAARPRSERGARRLGG